MRAVLQLTLYARAATATWTPSATFLTSKRASSPPEQPSIMTNLRRAWVSVSAETPTGRPSGRRLGQYNRAGGVERGHGGGSRRGIAQGSSRSAAVAGRQR